MLVVIAADEFSRAMTSNQPVYSVGPLYSCQRSFDLEIDRGRLAAVVLDLIFNVLAFIERA
jgi:hypothetical protein